MTRGLVAYVDDEDYDSCMEFLWMAKLSNHKVWYAATSGRDEYGRFDFYLHNLIMQPGDDQHVDHIDRNGLNCQKSNMRICTFSQNMANRVFSNGSGYRGVYVTKGGRYRAMIRKDDHLHYIGTYPTSEEAARAWDEAARELHGEYAVLNFPG